MSHLLFYLYIKPTTSKEVGKTESDVGLDFSVNAEVAEAQQWDSDDFLAAL